MKWIKLGNIFNPSTQLSNDFRFAVVPFVGKIQNNLINIYFNVRDKNNRSHLMMGVFDLSDNFSLVELTKEPLLSPGKIGTFDEDGAMGCQIIEINGESRIYYQGWNKAISVPFRNSIGFVIKEKNKLKRMYEGPILDRSIHDPCFVATPSVFKLSDDMFLMYYLSCDEWIDTENGLRHKYNIKIAESKDGINWDRKGLIAIDYDSDVEYAFSVPRIIKEDGNFKMWYSYRGNEDVDKYRIGYAESENGYNWHRKDDSVGIDVSDSGWDSDMICYPYIFDYEGERFMLYNGNNYGETGFGVAKLKNE